MKADDACLRTCGGCDGDEDAPVPAPTAAACADSTSWYWKKSKNTCEGYVTKKAKNCKKADDDGVDGHAACLMTCNQCDVEDAPAPAPTASQCADSTSWYFKKTKNSCERCAASRRLSRDGHRQNVVIVARDRRYVTKKSKNCKKKDEFKADAGVEREIFPQTTETRYRR